MQFLNAFLCCGAICALGQIIYEQTKLTAGHITSLFVVLGAALDTFGMGAGRGSLADHQLWSFAHSWRAGQRPAKRAHRHLVWDV